MVPSLKKKKDTQQKPFHRKEKIICKQLKKYPNKQKYKRKEELVVLTKERNSLVYIGKCAFWKARYEDLKIYNLNVSQFLNTNNILQYL